MKKINVWFNHWFSTAYHIINMIKDDRNIEFYIVGTNQNIESVVKVVCDHWEKEPAQLDGNEYIDYCLEFCKKHSIDVFVPRKNQLLIVKNIEKFDKINVKVLAERDLNKLKILNNKRSTYELFKKLDMNCVPDYSLATDNSSFLDGCQRLREKYNKICFKFVEDEGAASFRIIEENRNKFDFFDGEKEFPEVIIMPYLDGKEVSIDCLKTKNGLIMVPREKTDTRTEIIKYDVSLLEICKEFFEKCPIEHPCNIQFKYFEGKPYLLEINTRMSGGIQYSCIASQVNIPNIAINQLLNIDKNWIIDKSEKKISYIEMPVLM